MIQPQPGAQEAFLACEADIAIYGGSAGGGKTFSVLLEPIRHLHNPNFSALFFRRNATMVRNQGGLWSEALSLYTQINGKARAQPMEFVFPSGATVKFAHLENETTIYDYQGAQIALICFDELTHFTEDQFFYMLSRNRSTCGVRPYVRATTNPDRDSWVRRLIDWWIDEDGFAIPERSGVLRYFVRVAGEFIWADSREALKEYDINGYSIAKSITFIRATLEDNKILTDADPDYLANLKAQNYVEQARLLSGNWNISASDMGALITRSDFERYELSNDYFGKPVYPYFKQTYFVVDAAAKVKDANDYSVIGFFGKTLDNRFYIIDWVRIKLEAPELEQKMLDMWAKWQHMKPQAVWIEQGSSGISLSQHLRKSGIPIIDLIPIKDKFLRLNEVLGVIKAKYVHIPKQAHWVDKFIIECESFRADMKHIKMDQESKPHDDQVDVLVYGLGNEINLANDVKGYMPPPKPTARRRIFFD